MFKNVASQKLIVFAFDATANTPKTGDAANITAYVSKDFGAVTVLTDTSATEMEATNAKGYYLFDLAQAETNADTLLFSAKSSTANIVVIGVPATVFTVPPNFTTTSIDSNGRVDVIKIAGTTQTARDIGASVLLSSGTGTGQLDFTSGVVKANATQWLGGTIPAVNVTGVPLVDAKYLLGTIFSTPATAGILDVNVKNIDNDAASASGTVTFPNATLASTTNITAGTLTTVTTATNVTTVNGLAAGVITAASIAADAITDAKVASDVTIASVTGAVGSVTGAVGSVTGAVGSVTGNVGGNVTGSVGSIATGGIAAASFAAGAIDAAAIAANAIGASELAADAVAEIADGVWDEVLSGHLTSGTTGAALNAAGSAGDPWSTTLPGAYGAGTAGFIIGTNLDALVGSRMATYTQPTGFLAATFPATVASTTNITAGTITTVTNLTNAPTAGDFTATMKTSLNAATPAVTISDKTGFKLASDGLALVTAWTVNITGNLSGSVGSVTGAVGSVTGNVGGNVVGSVASVTAGVTVTTNSDKTGYALSATGLDAIAVTDPGVPSTHTTLPKMMVALWRRFFKKSTMTASELATYADDGTTKRGKATLSDDLTTQTVGAAADGP